VIFRKGALLKQHVAAAVKNENTERAMQNGAAMCFHFFHGTNGFIQFINQYYFSHYSDFIRFSCCGHSGLHTIYDQLFFANAACLRQKDGSTGRTLLHGLISPSSAQLSLTGFSILPA
jgi:hypothetical protein